MSKNVTLDQAQKLCAICFNRLVDKSYNVSTGEIISHLHVNANALDGAFYSCPTVSEALDYLREEKGVECGVFPIMQPVRDGLKMLMYAYRAYDLNKNCKRLHFNLNFVTGDYNHTLASSALLTAVLDYLEKKGGEG